MGLRWKRGTGKGGGGAQVRGKDRVGSGWTESVGFIVQLKAPNQ